MQIWAESGKSALPICNYSQILYQFLTFTQNLKRSLFYALNKTTNAETYLLSAETVFDNILEEENGYSKTTCQYLYNLYRRWQKPELADEYKQKLLISSK